MDPKRSTCTWFGTLLMRVGNAFHIHSVGPFQSTRHDYVLVSVNKPLISLCNVISKVMLQNFIPLLVTLPSTKGFDTSLYHNV